MDIARSGLEKVAALLRFWYFQRCWNPYPSGHKKMAFRASFLHHRMRFLSLPARSVLPPFANLIEVIRYPARRGTLVGFKTVNDTYRP
ncbi:MAG: hypothetical protein [Circular genetic element sp.]|nr:MAG: hypothetical protein [Circular genetic element sp.]